MTCIAGLVDAGRVWIGGDSIGAIPTTWSAVTRKDPKVFRVGPYLIGYTDSFRMGQLLRYRLNVGLHPLDGRSPDEVDVFDFMATTFVEAVRKCLNEGGYAEKDKERESGGSFLVAYCGRLFEVGSDYAVGENALGYAAVGSGRDQALGALYATAGLAPPMKRLELALEAAAEHCMGVRGPFVIEAAP